MLLLRSPHNQSRHTPPAPAQAYGDVWRRLRRCMAFDGVWRCWRRVTAYDSVWRCLRRRIWQGLTVLVVGGGPLLPCNHLFLVILKFGKGGGSIDGLNLPIVFGYTPLVSGRIFSSSFTHQNFSINFSGFIPLLTMHFYYCYFIILYTYYI